MMSRIALVSLILAGAALADLPRVPTPGSLPAPVDPFVPGQPGAPVVPGTPGVDIPASTVIFDCVDGPGYMRITVVDIYGNYQTRTPFLGSRKDCQKQAETLRQHRSTIVHPSIVAVCSPTPSYQLRWQIDQWGNISALPQTYYANRADCLSDATALNSQP